MNVRVLDQELLDLLGLVRRQVVGDDVDLLALGLVGHEVGEEGDELGRGVSRGGLAQHLAGLGVEGCVQRQRAMPVVLEAVALGTPRRQRQHRVFAVQGLDRGLLVHAEHGRMLRRVQVQADNVSGLGLELRIVGSQIALKPMRLELVLGPDARHRHVRDGTAEFGGELARRPVRRAVSGLALGSPRQHTCLDAIGHPIALASGVACKRSGKPIGDKALAPPIDVAVAAIELGANLGPCPPFGQKQDQSGVSRRIGSTVPRAGLSLQFHESGPGQFHRALHRRNCSSYLRVTVP